MGGKNPPPCKKFFEMTYFYFQRGKNILEKEKLFYKLYVFHFFEFFITGEKF